MKSLRQHQATLKRSDAQEVVAQMLGFPHLFDSNIISSTTLQEQIRHQSMRRTKHP